MTPICVNEQCKSQVAEVFLTFRSKETVKGPRFHYLYMSQVIKQNFFHLEWMVFHISSLMFLILQAKLFLNLIF